ncbi:DUF4760 domain-containing protein [Stutzerimonas kunmingensis]|uniref:DUF4760 domain-containing protein n=1 Tax=Stutzerimonas kunmingensis TaxID=1211807 RepID=A0A9X1N7M7_9GAMM|nr:DUF4760 domain-containing protein [Stutzerimonas kunmingensis]MCD1610272.1 DUF4760 domain-containing protein [Stutzerimonas kunmingensis]PNF99470.1 hypothetical protein CXK98_18335 [Stutzerimonas kunmingensis]
MASSFVLGKEMEILTEAWKLLGQPQVATLVLLIGVGVAIRSINMNRLVEQEKETVQLLFNARNDEVLSGGMDLLERVHDDPNNNIRAYGKEKKQDPDAVQIRYVLNHWERIAIAIRRKTYSEEIIKAASCSSLISIHEQATPMIKAIREATGKQTYYQELDWLANRWSKRPLRARK